MIIRFIYNTIIDIVTLICIIFWIAIGITIVIPLLYNAAGGDYFYLKGFIEDMELNKIPKNKQ